MQHILLVFKFVYFLWNAIKIDEIIAYISGKLSKIYATSIYRVFQKESPDLKCVCYEKYWTLKIKIDIILGYILYYYYIYILILIL